MHDILSERLSRFTKSASSAEAQVAQKSDLLELAQLCQIVPQNQYLVEAVALALSPAVNRVFGAASLIVALTETSRRQVYFAVIAHLELRGAIKQIAGDEAKRLSLIESLVLARSDDLICQHYGSCPKGFLRLLARLGDRAYSADVYLGLHHLLTVKPDLGRDLCELARQNDLSDGLVEVLMSMSETTLCARLARHFNSIDSYRQFCELYRILTGENELTEVHRERLYNGEKPGHLLEALYLAIPFPEPQIAAPGLRHIKNGADLVSISKRFKNCLHDYVAEAIRNVHQYYVWSKKGAPPVILRIQNDAPFGWFLAEMRLAANNRVPTDLKLEIKALLGHWGVRTGRSVESMMRPHRCQMDEFVLDDELFELHAA